MQKVLRNFGVFGFLEDLWELIDDLEINILESFLKKGTATSYTVCIMKQILGLLLEWSEPCDVFDE